MQYHENMSKEESERLLAEIAREEQMLTDAMERDGNQPPNEEHEHLQELERGYNKDRISRSK